MHTISTFTANYIVSNVVISNSFYIEKNMCTSGCWRYGANIYRQVVFLFLCERQHKTKSNTANQYLAFSAKRNGKDKGKVKQHV